MALSASDVKALYKTLGLPAPSAARIEDLTSRYSNLTALRDNLLSWGKNQGGNTYKKMIEGLVSKHLRGTEISGTQFNSIVEQIISGKATLEQKYADIDKYIHKGSTGGTGPTTGAPAGEEKNKEGIGIDDGDPNTPDLKILKGKEMKYYFDDKTGKWYIEYGLPGSDRSMIFEATPDQMDLLFGEGRRPAGYERATLKQLTQREGVTFGGDISEMEGEGSFEAEVQRIQTLALDNGVLPDWAKKSGAAMDIIYTAQAEGKSSEWVVDQLSKLPEFKNRFPNIQKFAKDNNLTMTEAIGGFLEYEAGLRQAYKAAGLNVDAVNPALVGNMLEAGHSLEVVNKTVSSWKRMKQYKPALDAFNKVLIANGKEPLKNLNEYMKFVSGEASADLYEIYEQSSLQEAAQAAGLGNIFSATDAIKLSQGTSHTLESATAGMQKAAELLLRMRSTIDLGQYGLTTEELIDVNLGSAPRSGRSSAEIFAAMNRAVKQAQAKLQGGTQPYTGFTDQGTPAQTSLSGLRVGS